MTLFAKKSLGQNFLIQPQIVRDIVDAAEISVGEKVVEVGPGTGILTKELLNRGAHVIAIEKDDRLVEDLGKTFEKELSTENLELIHGDILDDIPYIQDDYKVVANIPYYITGKIIRLFLEQEHKPTSMTLLVQKEVAERIVAHRSANKVKKQKESVLSISIKVYGKPTYVRTVRAGNFRPAPKVDSAVVHINNITTDNFSNTSEPHFFDILHEGFASKRKKLFKNLKKRNIDGMLDQAFMQCRLEKNVRAEDLSVEDWVCLARALQ